MTAFSIRILLVPIVMFAFTGGGSVFAQTGFVMSRSSESKRNNYLKVKNTAKSSSKLKKEPEDEKSWSVTAMYSVAIDLLQEESPRSFRNYWNLSVSYEAMPNWELYSNLGVQYMAVGNEVSTEKGNVEVSDVEIGSSKRFNLGKGWGGSHSLELGLSSAFPTSESARYEGYKAVPSLSLMPSSQFFDKVWNISHELSYSYIANTYEYSPSSNEINPESSFSYLLMNKVKLYRGLALTGGIGFSATRYVDGSNIMNKGPDNTVGLSLTWRSLTTSLAYLNSSYVERSDNELWFIDEYRKIIRFRLSYTF